MARTNRNNYSIYRTAEIDALLAARSRDGEQDRSAIISRVAGRYAELVERERPELSEGEWNFFRDILNGTSMLDSWSVNYLGAEAEDAIRLTGADEKWEIDGKSLIKRIQRWSYAQKLAVVDAVERWWAQQAH